MGPGIVIDHDHIPGTCPSIASTGFAQSPANVCTVTACPIIFTSPHSEKMPFIAPLRCIASDMLGDETFWKISRISSLPWIPFDIVSPGESIEALIREVLDFTSAERVIHPPTMTISAPDLTASAAVPLSRPPATAMGIGKISCQ